MFVSILPPDRVLILHFAFVFKIFQNFHLGIIRLLHYGNCYHFPWNLKEIPPFMCILEDDSAGDTVQVVPDIGPTIKAVAASQMEAAMVALSRELAKLRTGRASAGAITILLLVWVSLFSSWFNHSNAQSIVCFNRNA